MSSYDFTLFALQLATMLAVALVLGELMRRIRQPAVLGEMIGGILLGPTVLGTIAPAFFFWLFLSVPSVTAARDATIKLGMLFFLFVAGLDTNLADLRRMARGPALIGLIGTLVPIGVGVALVYALPRSFWGPVVQPHFLAFALFVGMNLANSANPVLARILMDLGLLRTEIGATMMTATIVDDLVNWTLFAIILRDIAPSGSVAVTNLPISIVLVLVFFAAVLFLGRRLGPPALHWVKVHLSWPMGLIGVTSLAILVVSSLAEMLGIHAFLGAFLAGVGLTGDDAEHESAHEIVGHFALSFFAPIYFVSIGLSVNFATNFDFWMVLIFLVAALGSKLGAVMAGAWLARMPMNRATLAIAFGLNARGATGIILAGVGLVNGMIDERIFVAMVVMCLVTSLIAAPAMHGLLQANVEPEHP